MKISFVSTTLNTQKVGLLALLLRRDEKLTGEARALDRLLDGFLSAAISDQDFTGKSGQTILLHTHGKIPAAHVALIGLGDNTAEAWRQAGAVAVRQAKGVRVATVAIVSSAAMLRQPAAVSQALTEGALLGSYEFNKYKGKKKEQTPKPLKELLLLGPARLARRAQQGIERGQRFSDATILVRDMVNEPSSHMTPTVIKEKAEAIAESTKGVRLKVFDQAALKKMGAGALLGMAKGSDEPPYLLHLSYVPKGAKKVIALVGKGITFDSGGINLKPEAGMSNMKMDMAGAATILGIFLVLTALKPKVAVHGIIPTCENMPSGKAVKPGDILTAMDGTTIEVLNTDAEGRVILADGIAYARKLKPAAMIDIATLTGAVIVALGEEVAGAMGNTPVLTNRILAAAKTVGEPMWELPLVESYKPLIEGTVGDIQNLAKSRYGGAITGGLFLEHFAGQTPWVHLDIAGPVWEERGAVPYLPKGATGFSVRTLLEYLSHA